MLVWGGVLPPFGGNVSVGWSPTPFLGGMLVWGGVLPPFGGNVSVGWSPIPFWGEC